MAVLIADSGSTKTDWCIVSREQAKEFVKTVGLNPFFVDSKIIEKIAFSNFRSISDEISNIYFYGAGCVNKEKNEFVYDGLKKVFQKAEISIFPDILGAARVLFGNDDGLAVILGTGQATCYYSNHEIKFSIPSAGFLLGDEGSGAYLGLQLLKAYFHGDLPSEIKLRFEKKFDLDIQELKRELYSASHTSKYLASFAGFINDNKHVVEIDAIISLAFEQLIEKYILKYPEANRLKIGFCGSIAFHFKEILEKTCEKYGLITNSFIKRPIDYLADYHNNNLRQ